MKEGNMNFFGTGAAGVLGSGSTPWLLISIGPFNHVWVTVKRKGHRKRR
jgi:hypothetical protein